MDLEAALGKRPRGGTERQGARAVGTACARLSSLALGSLGREGTAFQVARDFRRTVSLDQLGEPEKKPELLKAREAYRKRALHFLWKDRL